VIAERRRLWHPHIVANELRDLHAHEVGLLDQRRVAAVLQKEHLATRDRVGHALREIGWREGVALGRDDQHRHLDLREQILGAVLTGRVEHAEEEAGIDRRDVLDVRPQVLGPHVLDVDLAHHVRELHREIGRHARPQRAHDVGVLTHPVDQLRQDLREHLRAVEGLGDLAGCAAAEDQRADTLGPHAVGLERDLYAERVPNENDRRRIVEVTTNGVEIGGEVDDLDAIGIGRRSAATMPSIVPMGDGTDER
jgi:hypothetical protein